MTAPVGTAGILQREWGSATGLLDALGPEEWGRPTRCAGWTVLDLARHTVWGVSMEADALRRLQEGEAGPADGTTLPEESTGADALTALRDAVDELVKRVGELTGAAPDEPVPMPYGAVPLAAALHIFVFEAAIHASDVADALGTERSLAPDVVPSVVAVLEGFLPMMAAATTADLPVGSSFLLEGSTVRLGGRWEEGSGLVMGAPAAEPTVRVTGDDSSVLLFAVGRLGADDPRLTVAGSDELARDFKRLVPGP